MASEWLDFCKRAQGSEASGSKVGPEAIAPDQIPQHVWVHLQPTGRGPACLILPEAIPGPSGLAEPF